MSEEVGDMSGWSEGLNGCDLPSYSGEGGGASDMGLSTTGTLQAANMFLQSQQHQQRHIPGRVHPTPPRVQYTPGPHTPQIHPWVVNPPPQSNIPHYPNQPVYMVNQMPGKIHRLSITQCHDINSCSCLLFVRLLLLF